MAAPDWMPPSYLKSLRALMPSEAEYGHVEYLLKLALRSAAVRVLSVHALHSAEDNVRFEREHERDVVLDSWCSTASLPEDNTVSQLAGRGGRFRIADSERGVLFPSGAVRLYAGDEGHGRPSGAMQLEFLHLRLASGRAFVMERGQVSEQPIPEGYESVKVHGEGEDGSYYHEYILSEESRIWPSFVVNCVYDPEDDRRGLAGMHHRVASWRVHCYQEAYGRSMDDLEKEHRLVEERRKVIVRQLQNIDERMQLVTRNHAHAQDEIYQVVQQVVQLLHSRTQAKLNLLLSDDAELRRQLQYFDWLDAFLQYQKGLLERSLLDPVEFLQNVQRHRDAVADAPSEIVDSYKNVHADIKVVGNLTVQIDSSAAAQQQGQRPRIAGPESLPSQLGPNSSSYPWNPPPHPQPGAAPAALPPTYTGGAQGAPHTPLPGGTGSGAPLWQQQTFPRWQRQASPMP
eukprot:Hpha_TRINITY_DN16896_c0_g10::TRINITY_DN16896_c0_g10_i1::g.149225::m.149225